jgi:hypothetical protein
MCACAGLQPIKNIKPIIKLTNRQTSLKPVISWLDGFDEFIDPVYPGPNRSQDRILGQSRFFNGHCQSYRGLLQGEYILGLDENVMVTAAPIDEAVHLSHYCEFGARFKILSQRDQICLMHFYEKEAALILQGEASVARVLHLHLPVKPSGHQDQRTAGMKVGAGLDHLIQN